jgi:uncharacterized protein (TIGR02186 family)
LSRIWTVLASVLLLAGPARAEPLVADLSKQLVAITAGFAGANVLMFGAVEEPGDVVVIVKGPAERLPMHRKSRIGGIWIKTATMTFEEVPSFYAIFSSRPLEEIASESVLARYEMGVERLKLELPRAKASPDLAQVWRQALIRNKQRQNLYSTEVKKVVFRGERLFRTEVTFPDNVPTGDYLVTVYLIKDKKVERAQTTSLKVEKSGVEADIFYFAHEQSALYGIVAIFLALMAGWLAHVVFRKR